MSDDTLTLTTSTLALVHANRSDESVVRFVAMGRPWSSFTMTWEQWRQMGYPIDISVTIEVPDAG